jgi:hypothetical protein
MLSQVPVIERADAFEDGRKFLLRCFSEADADDFDELFPTDEISEMADVFNELFSRIHI